MQDERPTRKLDDRRVLHTLGFTTLAFMLVAGGPFGFEAAVRAAGPLPCFVGFMCFPLLWSLPQALVTAELSSKFPDTGGSILWATRAFGDFAGLLSGVNGLLAAIIDLALYPALVASALSAFTGVLLNPVVDWFIRICVVAAVTSLNFWGLNVVSHFSAASLVLVITPFLGSFVVQLPAVLRGGLAWAQVAAKPDWSIFMPIMLWSYSGWDGLGVFAGEVNRPSTTYFRGVLLTLAAVTSSYAVPLIVSIQTHPQFQHWGASSFVQFCGDVGPVVQAVAALAAVVSPMSTMAACLAASTRMALVLGSGGGSTPVRHLPRVCSHELRGGTPAVALLAHAGILCVASSLTFGVLVQLTVILGSLRILIMLAAFVRLRLVRLDHRAGDAGPASGASGTGFVVPFGFPGIVAVTAPQVLVVLIVLANSQREVVACAVLANVAAVAVFAVRAAIDRHRYGVWWPRGFLNLAVAGVGGVPGLASSRPQLSSRREQPEPLKDVIVDDCSDAAGNAHSPGPPGGEDSPLLRPLGPGGSMSLRRSSHGRDAWE